MFNNTVSCNRKDSLVSRGSFAVSVYIIGSVMRALLFMQYNFKNLSDIRVEATQAESNSRLALCEGDRVFQIVAFGDVCSLAYSLLKARTNLNSNFLEQPI